MDADYSFYVKSVATYAPAFLVYNNSVLARVVWLVHNQEQVLMVHIMYNGTLTAIP